MISQPFQQTVYSWATTNKTNFEKILSMCDTLKGIGKGKALAILAPSYLMHKINYRKLIDNPKIHTMTINNGYLMPGTENCEYYQPLTTLNKTSSMNNKPDYVKWLNKFNGLVLHGLHHNDGTNSTSPYVLASQDEVKDIIRKCPKTKFSIWHHSWGDYIKKHGVPGMLQCPYFDQWTPRRLPWGHCGAISGFSIPLAMALGYSRIYIVGMGYRYVINGYHNPQGNKLDQTKVAADSWLQFANKRFANQAKLAEDKGIAIRVGPENLIEPELKKLFRPFKAIENCT